jgi:rod shape-determining protein MreD
MKNFLGLTLTWLLVAVVGEELLAPLLKIGEVQPNFAVIALVILALAEGSFAGTVGGFVLGLAQDVSVANLLGLNALCKSALGYTVGRLRGRIVYGIPIIEVLVIVLAVLVHDTFYLLVSSHLNNEAFLGPFALEVLPGALYSGLVGLPLIRGADILGVLRRAD